MAGKPKLPAFDGWADSAEEWADAKFHRIVMPSGRKAVIALPELGALVLADAVPEEYLELARQELTHALGLTGAYAEQMRDLGDTDEDQRKAAELTRSFSALLKWLVAEHVLVEPKMRPEEITEERLPLRDLEWLYQVATRRTDEDALGRRLGVARLDEYARFRHHHGLECPPDCEACIATIDDLSTLHVGAL